MMQGLSEQDQLWSCLGIAPDDSVLLELSTDLTGIVERDAQHEEAGFFGPTVGRVFASTFEES